MSTTAAYDPARVVSDLRHLDARTGGSDGSSIAGLSPTKEEDTPEEHLRMAADAFHRTCRRALDLVAGGEL